MKEIELRAPVRAHLEAQGYRTWADPDGHDYFDIVALRGEELGLVELKVSAARQVFGQALRRRAWADWVAVAIPGRRAAARLIERAGAERSERIGVWVVADGRVEELRPARALYRPDEEAPFERARAALRTMLRALESGAIPEGSDWGIFGSPRLPGAHRRSTRDWRLEEFPEPSTSPASERRPARSAPPSDRS